MAIYDVQFTFMTACKTAGYQITADSAAAAEAKAAACIDSDGNLVFEAFEAAGGDIGNSGWTFVPGSACAYEVSEVALDTISRPVADESVVPLDPPAGAAVATRRPIGGMSDLAIEQMEAEQADEDALQGATLAVSDAFESAGRPMTVEDRQRINDWLTAFLAEKPAFDAEREDILRRERDGTDPL